MIKMQKKRPVAINSRLIFAAIILIALVTVILSANSSITGNLFVKTIQKVSTTQIIVKNVSNSTASTNTSSAAVSIVISDSTKISKTTAIVTGEDMLIYLEGVRKTLAVGETWLNFAFGYDVRATSIDARASPKEALIAVYKKGTMKDSAIVEEGEFYDYIEDYAGYDNLIVFRINISRIFAGTTSDFVELKDNYASSAAIDACNPAWGCSVSQCMNYKIERTNCIDSNGCHKSEGKPAAIERCKDNKTLSVGQTWYMADDNSLQAISIDARASPKQALLVFTWRYSATGAGESKIAKEGELFEIVKRWNGYDNITVFSTRIASIYAGATSDMVKFADTYLHSTNLCSSCEQLWRCSAWSSCINSIKTRTCTDLANCSSRWSASDLEIGCDVGLPLTALACVPTVADTGTAVMRNATVRTTVNLSEEQQNTSTPMQNLSAVYAGGQVQTSGSAGQEASEIAIEKDSEDKKIIRKGDDAIETQLDISEESLQLFISTSEGEEKQIVFPDSAISEIRKSREIEKIVLEKENEKPVYHVYTTKKVKVLIVFSASLDEELKIDAESGEIIETKTPWWSFLAK